MRIKRGIAIPVTLAATLATAMGLAAPAYAQITAQECQNRGGTVYRAECEFYVSDDPQQPQQQGSGSPAPAPLPATPSLPGL